MQKFGLTSRNCSERSEKQSLVAFTPVFIKELLLLDMRVVEALQHPL